MLPVSPAPTPASCCTGATRARFEGMGVMGREGLAGLWSPNSHGSCSGMTSSSHSDASRLRDDDVVDEEEDEGEEERESEVDEVVEEW